jgi:caffeoyl-CoA O-methyltransferase
MATDLLLEYSESHTTPEIPLMARLNRETHLTQVNPQMLSGHLQGALLRMITQMIRPERVLEIGTFTGYSAIAMAMGMSPYADPADSTMTPYPDPADSGITRPLSPIDSGKSPLLAPVQSGIGVRAVLHTIEVNPELEDGIRRFIREAGLEEQILLHMGNALDIISTLEEVWDLVFLDADKPNYLNYYEMVFPRLRPGGFIIADNVLWGGKVLGDPEKMDKDTRGIIAFNEFVHRDERVENVLLPIRDGLMIIRKK